MSLTIRERKKEKACIEMLSSHQQGWDGGGVVRKNGSAVEDECKRIQSCLLSKTSVSVIEHSVIIGVLDFCESSSNKKQLYLVFFYLKSQDKM